HHRQVELRPEIIAEVQRTRAFGDLSENYEYKAAKQAQRENDSRIRYLENMIKTAKIIEDDAQEGVVGLFDKVTIYLDEDDEESVIQVVTTVRCDPSKGFISKESPLGKAVLGKKVGDRVTVQVSADYSYTLEIRKLEKGEDNGDAPLMRY
ncbi:MAG: transcription elongation factor GreA, partial [Oscillospiraceae bacterium]|nr:transcription elongation factor GreA [Oscillospiraceae bacterium]